MTGFLTRMIDQQLRRLTLGAILGIAVVSTAAVAASRFHDANLDLAEAAIEKAQGLLALTVCGNPGEKTTEDCDKLVQKAQDLLAKTRDAVNAAAVAADGGDVDLPH